MAVRMDQLKNIKIFVNIRIYKWLELTFEYFETDLHVLLFYDDFFSEYCNHGFPKSNGIFD